MGLGCSSVVVIQNAEGPGFDSQLSKTKQTNKNLGVDSTKEVKDLHTEKNNNERN